MKETEQINIMSAIDVAKDNYNEYSDMGSCIDFSGPMPEIFVKRIPIKLKDIR